MQLSVSDACRLLNVPERTLYRWVRRGLLPARKVGDDYRFNRVELLEWAARERISINTGLPGELGGGDEGSTVAEALRAGGVHDRITGDDNESVLRSVVRRLDVPSGVDREFLLSVLLAREWLGSTGVGDGIAIPHVRNPLVVDIQRPNVALCYLEHPVDFGALDGKAVSVLFLVLTPTVRAHLRILGRLAFLLKDESFRTALASRPGVDELVTLVRTIESRLDDGRDGAGGAGPDR